MSSMDIPTRCAGNHDCELHYELAAVTPPRNQYACTICGATIWLTEEQRDEQMERRKKKWAKIEAIPLHAPEHNT